MAELLSVERLFGDGCHNAFTDLKFWKGHYYLCFRMAQSHGVADPGEVVVHRCADSKKWESCARSQEEDLPEDRFARYGEQPAPAGHHTSVWMLAGERVVHELTLPSGGDYSYADLAHGPDGEVAMSYYWQHLRLPLPADRPTPSDIFLARFRL